MTPEEKTELNALICESINRGEFVHLLSDDDRKHLLELLLPAQKAVLEEQKKNIEGKISVIDTAISTPVVIV